MTREFSQEEMDKVRAEFAENSNVGAALVLQARAERDEALARLREWEGGKANWERIEENERLRQWLEAGKVQTPGAQGQLYVDGLQDGIFFALMSARNALKETP